MRQSLLVILLLAGILITLNRVSAQEVPQAFNYASIYFDGDGPVSSTDIIVRASILASDDSVFSETHQTTTSVYGNYAIMVGEGQEQDGQMEDIDWSITDKKLRIEIAENGDDFQLISENNFMSVPFVLVALDGEGETGPTGYAGLDDLPGPCENTGWNQGNTGPEGWPANSPWSFSEYTQWYNEGNIGIGTEEPQEKLHVVGDLCYTGTATACSDRRYKNEIEEIENAVSAILFLRAVNYEWDLETFPVNGFDEKTQLGLIAQEVEKVLPEAVSTNSDGYKSVEYSKLSALLIEAIQEQQDKIQALKSRKANITARVKSLENSINK